MQTFIDKYKKILLLATGIALIALPVMLDNTYLLTVCVKIGSYTLLGLGLNVLTGYTGLVSLGHAGFVAIGAYTSSLCAVKLGMNFFPAMLLGMLVSGLVGVLLGLPTLTISNYGLYDLMLVLVVLTTLFCIALVKSKTGRALQAIRADELASTMMGINVTSYKILAFVISACICAVGGALYSSLIGYIDPNTFNFDVSTLILSIVILGGMGTIRGMFIGAALLIAFPEVSRFLMEYRFVLYGVILVLMMRFRPQGILGWKSTMPYHLTKRVQKEVEAMDQYGPLNLWNETKG